MSEIAESSASYFGGIIKDFLLDCGNRRKFDAFFAFCLNHTVSYLRYLRNIGYDLPIEKAPEEDPFTDLAMDVLGPLFKKDRCGRYFIITDYFSRQGINDWGNSSDDLLFSHMSILLRGFARKQLRLIKKDNSPQIFNLKRRFREIIAPPDYGEFSEPGSSDSFVFHSQFAQNLRKEKELLIAEGLARLVYRAFCDSINHTGWCLKIFTGLNDDIEFKNYLKKYELISTAVSVKADFIDLHYHQWGPATPEEHAIARQADNAIECALKNIRENSLVRFLEKGRITPQQAELMATAVKNFLLDRTNDGQAEKLPVYFREQLPDIDQEAYLKEYKYIFDTVTSDAVRKFTEFFHE